MMGDTYWWVVLKFCLQEGVCEIPVPKWSDQGDALDLHFKKPLNFENSYPKTVKF